MFSQQPSQICVDVIGLHQRKMQQGFRLTLTENAPGSPFLPVLAWVALAVLDHAAVAVSADSLQVRTACVTDDALGVPRHLCLAAVVNHGRVLGADVVEQNRNSGLQGRNLVIAFGDDSHRFCVLSLGYVCPPNCCRRRFHKGLESVILRQQKSGVAGGHGKMRSQIPANPFDNVFRGALLVSLRAHQALLRVSCCGIVSHTFSWQIEFEGLACRSAQRHAAI
jgi:hypothetical protein